MDYRKKLAKLNADCHKKHQQLSACRNCMTVFYPFFPKEEFHLHEPSESFKKHMSSKFGGKAMEKVADSGEPEDSFTYQALVGLAKEADAYREDEYGNAYIKLLRFVRGHRRHKSKGYEKTEFCENCSVEGFPEQVAEEKYRIENLAAGIHTLVNL